MMVTTLDSESSDRGLNPRGTFIYYSVFDAMWLSVNDYLHSGQQFSTARAFCSKTESPSPGIEDRSSALEAGNCSKCSKYSFFANFSSFQTFLKF